MRWRGRITIPKGGIRRLGIEGNDGYRLWVDGSLVIDNWRKVSFGTRQAVIALAPSSVHAIRLEYFESTGNARLRLLWDAKEPVNFEGEIWTLKDAWIGASNGF